MQSWAALACFAVILPLIFYRLTSRPVLFALLSALVATSALQFWLRVLLGYADEMWPIAAAMSFGGSFTVSLAVVFAWRRLDRR